MIILETTRLTLKTWDLTEAESALKLWGNIEVMKYVGKPLENLEKAQSVLEKAKEIQSKKGFSLWAVIEKKSETFIGACGFHQFEEKDLEIVYHFLPEFWGKGFAFEAVSASIKYAFTKLNCENIVGIVDVENTASEKVLKKNGFVYIETKVFDEKPEKMYHLKKEFFLGK